MHEKELMHTQKNPSVESSPACARMASPPGCSSTEEVTSYTYSVSYESQR